VKSRGKSLLNHSCFSFATFAAWRGKISCDSCSPHKAEGLSAISASHAYHLRGSINSAALREKSDNQGAVFGLNKKVMKSGEEHCLETYKLLQWPPPMAATNLKGNQTTNLTAICLSLRLAVNARDWIETS